MSRIHPSDQSRCHGHLLFRNHRGGRKRPLHDDDDHKHRDQVAASSVMLTVWKRSSMSFQGTDGFTVFGPHGTLVFRVDNYSRKNGCGLVLMDGVGNALLSLKPKILSMQYQWRAYRGDQDGCGKANVFFMRSPSVLSNFQAAGRKHVAEIFMGTHSGGHHQSMPDLKIEGSFRSRDCKIVKTCTGEVVARISRKRVMNNTTILLSDDVFSLVVHPGFDTHLIMAFVIVLDRISSKPFSPFLCS
uniref:Protein LURP-one-related 5-like n=1 Tax=Salix viminalis TaxID=40686 RepID=A0A6N2KMI7_SALVM